MAAFVPPLKALQVAAGLTLALLPAAPQAAATPGAAFGADLAPAAFCRIAIAAAEAQANIPAGFLSAIGRVESGGGPAGNAPWPWTVNAGGEGHFYLTKEQAIAAVHAFQAAGLVSIDTGCLQVNLQAHPEAFSTLEKAFDPATNAAYAANFLTTLFHQTGSWPAAAAAYHSQTPAIGRDYQQKVLAAWASPTLNPEASSRAIHAFSKAAGLTDPRLPYRARTQTAAVDPPLPDNVPANPMGQAGTAPPPISGFNRVIREGGPVTPRGPIGRSLASYRAMPVRLAAKLPMSTPTPR